MVYVNEQMMLNRIMQLAEVHKNNIPKGIKKLRKHNWVSIDDVLKALDKVFDVEEQEILRFTYSIEYERGVSNFAKELMSYLSPFHMELQYNELYRVLLGRRHIAYGFYSVRKSMGDAELEHIDSFYEEKLYLGLVDFYNKFCGRFWDNEEAIELLCRFYPQKLDLKIYEEKISSTLYTHISYAGTPNDRGYAYGGIELMKRYMQNLPESLIYAILKEFALYEIINNEIHRHQLFTVIAYSRIKDAEKNKLKFWYLDSLLIADALNKFLIRKLKEQGILIEAHNNYYDYKLLDDALIVFDEPYFYWGNVFSQTRVLYQGEKAYMYITLYDKCLVIGCLENGKKEVFPYEYSDWKLEMYHGIKANQKLKQFVFETRATGERKPMVFSLVYLNRYRGLQNQVIDFDHRFYYDDKNHMLSKNTTKSAREEIPHIYGKSVYSLSCIVGKNAAGKTSIIDFLREAFFKFLKLIEENKIICENGYVNASQYEEFGILDKGAEFLAVFSLGNKTYHLTNQEGFDTTDTIPYQAGVYDAASELSKVAYFSTQLRGDDIALITEDTTKQELSEKERISINNQGFRQVDYSEAAGFIRRRNAIANLKKNNYLTGFVNKELCYQISLLINGNKDDLYRELEIEENKTFFLMNSIREEKHEISDFKEIEINKEKFEKIQQLMKRPDTVIQHFSAGQYAKLSFWAKLHWFLNGEKEIGKFNKWTGELAFGMDEVLLSEETALIFIDEGEIYYHPEWQRKFIKHLLDMVNEKPRKIQIIVTTNSPFLISDILSEDIVYLSGNKNTGQKKEEDGTLGQNIHKLLRENFFMEYTIGEYARELIENVMLCLQEETVGEIDVDKILGIYFDEITDYYKALQLLIEQISEPVYKYSLMKMLHKSHFAKQRDIAHRIMALEEEKRKLQEQIDILRENQ